MKPDIRALYPSIYRGVREIGALAEVQDAQFEGWLQAMDQAREDQFVRTAARTGIENFERMFEIRALPEESLEFRRQRVLSRMRLHQPFTMRFLRNRLDEIIGPGQYRLGLDHNAYTLTIESAAENAGWYQEVYVMMGKIKPANIIFTFVPLVVSGLEMGETIVNQNYQWMYRLGSWQLGREPFGKLLGEEVLKLAETHSLQEEFLERHAAYTAGQVDRVLLNDTYEINAFQRKDSDGPVAEIVYMVPENLGVTEITNIKLLDGDGGVLSSAPVYIPVAGVLTLRHTIDHREKEAGANG